MAIPLPRELIECIIIDNLYSDRATLLNCALVGKFWALCAQRGIFQHITIELPSPYHEDFNELGSAYIERNELLLQLFDRKPFLASCVRILELRQFADISKKTFYDNGILYTSATRVVGRLANVKKLLFFKCDWTTLTPGLKTVLTDVFKSPSLTTVILSFFTISSFHELASLLSQVSNMKVLEIDFLYCVDGDTPPPIANCPPRSIQLDQLLHLHFIKIRAFTTWFLQDTCPLEVRRLRTLQIHRSTGSDHEGVALMLQYIGENLQELELQGPFRTQRALSQYITHYLNKFDIPSLDSTLVHLGYTPNLRSVTLVEVQQTDTYSPVPWILCLFEPFQNSNQLLRQLTVDLYIDHADILETRRWEEWSAVDTLLAEPAFASIESVTFEMRGPSAKAGSAKEVFSDKLHFLKNSGKLQVRIPVEEEVNTKSIRAITRF
ncbi:hypothetical protein J3R30DRAFT_3739434 [Lentinula aciculospora]|uniref:Uncharacterized protein n=1 Tax=Lentinula aciculospora TaxID=153920 RepID=A0A9W8ZWG6_9AGAR|nr:hypothetical protein J3R30DRAFT_3739434 [Lentinula aciculospora]